MHWTLEDLHRVTQQGQCRIVDAPPPPPPPGQESYGAMSEKAFMAAILKCATQHGWNVFHPWDSRKSAPGYPDLTLARAGESVIFAELKVGDAQPTLEQRAWLHTLAQATNTRVYLWRPSDWDAIVAVLTAPPKEPR